MPYSVSRPNKRFMTPQRTARRWGRESRQKLETACPQAVGANAGILTARGRAVSKGGPDKLPCRDDQAPGDAALNDGMLMMTRRRQRIPPNRHNFAPATLTFINPGMRRRRSRRVGRIEARIGKITQVMRV